MNAPCEARHFTHQPNPREGFGVGWNYAAHGMAPPGDAEPDILTGYAAGRQHFGTKTAKQDRFVRKWLHLQHNAWRRGRVFDAAVTPEYIERITPTHCPVTRELLTVATGKGSDWSVDRVVNDGGYAPGNLAVLSTRANLAKNAMDYGQILRIVASRQAHGGLNPLEWARLACIVGMVADEQSVLPMLVVPPRRLVVANRYTMLQLATMYAAIGSMHDGLAPALRKLSQGKKAKRALDTYLDTACAKVARMFRGKARNYDEMFDTFGDAWQDGQLLQAFKGWVAEMTGEGLRECLGAASRNLGAIRKVKPQMREAWSEETRGYVAA